MRAELGQKRRAGCLPLNQEPPVSEELALLCGVPLVALGRTEDSLPARAGVKGLSAADGLGALSTDTVLTALGLG